MSTSTLPRHLVASPGEILEEWIAEHDMTQRELADRLGKSEKFVSQLMNAKASLTPDTAQELELVTRVSAATWLRIEGEYRSTIKRTELVATAAASPIEAALVKVLRNLGVVTAPAGARGEQTIQVWKLLGVGSPQGLESLGRRRAAQFRTSATFAPDAVATEVVIALAHLEAAQMSVATLNLARLRAAVPRLRALTLLGAVEGSAQARTMLADVGVALVFLPNVPKAHCNGVTLWSGDHAIIAVTDRGRREDIFWFTLFHELSHVLDGDRNAIYLDSRAGDAEPLDAERRADAFATELLIPLKDEPWLHAISALADIPAVARKLGVSPGVLVGQLHHRELKPFSWGNRFIERIETGRSDGVD